MKNILILLLIISAFACKKNKTVEPVTETPNETTTLKGKINLEFEHVWGNQAYNFNQDYVIGVDTFRPSILKYYISNVVLKKADGSSFKVPESYYLIDASSSASSIITINNIPKGDYSAMEFLIGVDSTRNVSGAQVGALDPANGMFWTWNTGYIFFMIEGNVKSRNENLRHHNGGFKLPYNNIIKKVIPFNEIPLSIKPDANPQAHFMLDMKAYFELPNPINFDTDLNAQMPMRTQKMKENFDAAFQFDHLHP